MFEEVFLNQVHCVSWEDMLPLVPEKSVQLVMTSPPYEDMKDYRDKKKKRVAGEKTGKEFVKYYWHLFFSLLEPVMADDGVVVIVVNDKRKNGVISLSNYRGMIGVCDDGWNLIEHAPWLKTKGTGRKSGSLQDWWEHIFCFSKSTDYKIYPERLRGVYAESTTRRYGLPTDPKKTKLRKISATTTNKISAADPDIQDSDFVEALALSEEGKLLPNIVVVTPDGRRGVKHPARFPTELARWGITLFSDKGDLILDPMCGSGTVPCMAQFLGRNFAACDISDEYVKITNHELPKYREQLDLFGKKHESKFNIELPLHDQETFIDDND